jgi:hypothetical protein
MVFSWASRGAPAGWRLAERWLEPSARRAGQLTALPRDVLHAQRWPYPDQPVVGATTDVPPLDRESDAVRAAEVAFPKQPGGLCVSERRLGEETVFPSTFYLTKSSVIAVLLCPLLRVSIYTYPSIHFAIVLRNH